MTKREKPDPKKWWINPPRSSRICIRCEHKYSSHIECRCLKITQRKPTREECTCGGFIKNEVELEMDNARMERRRLRLEREAEENILIKDNQE